MKGCPVVIKNILVHVVVRIINDSILRRIVLFWLARLSFTFSCISRVHLVLYHGLYRIKHLCLLVEFYLSLYPLSRLLRSPQKVSSWRRKSEVFASLVWARKYKRHAWCMIEQVGLKVFLNNKMWINGTLAIFTLNCTCPNLVLAWNGEKGP